MKKIHETGNMPIWKRMVALSLFLCLLVGSIPALALRAEAAGLDLSHLTCANESGVRSDAVSFMDTMMKYYINNDTDMQKMLTDGKSVIFIFEGGSSNFDTTDYLNSGGDRNQAVVFVVQQHSGVIKIVFSNNDCSTIPSNTEKSTTVPDGTYSVYTCNHYGYAALTLSYQKGNGYNVHTRVDTSGEENKNWSTGCILISYGQGSNNKFNEFMRVVLRPFVAFSDDIYIEYHSGGSSNAESRLKNLNDINMRKDVCVGNFVINRLLACDKMEADGLYKNPPVDVDKLIIDSVDKARAAGVSLPNLPDPPTAPKGLNITKSGTDSLLLTWNAVSGATYYKVVFQRTGKNDKWYDDANGLTATSFNSTRLVWNATNYYTYRVYACNRGGSSYTEGTAYYIGYNANGGSGAPEFQIKQNGKTLTLSSTVPTRSGYTFLGWAESSSATIATYRPGGSYTKDAAVSLYALWSSTPNTNCKHSEGYTVKNIGGFYEAVCNACGAYYELPALNTSVAGTYRFGPIAASGKYENGIGSAPYIEVCTVCGVEGGEKPILGSVVNAFGEVWYKTSDNKYIFSGCMTKVGTSASTPSAPTSLIISKDSADSLLLTWTAVSGATSYYVEYSRSGRTWTKDIGDMPTTNRFVSTKLAWDKTDYYSFRVYAENSNGRSTAYAEGTAYYIGYNANGGSGAPEFQIKQNGKTLTLSSTVPTRSGYTFLGWAESSSATTATYLPGGSYTKDAAATLYAVWTIHSTVSVLSAPTNLKATSPCTTNSNIDISWNSVSGATYYVIEYKNSKTNGSWVELTESKDMACTGTFITGHTFGWSYYYVDIRVKACNSSGSSEWAEIRLYKKNSSALFSEGLTEVVSLPVSAYMQTEEWSCGHAATKAVLSYFGKANDKTDTALYGNGAAVEGATIQRKLNEYLGSDYYQFNSEVSKNDSDASSKILSRFLSSLNAGNPVIILIGLSDTTTPYFPWYSNTSAHNTTVTGLYTDSQGGYWVEIMDSYILKSKFSGTGNQYRDPTTGTIYLPLSTLVDYMSDNSRPYFYIIYSTKTGAEIPSSEVPAQPMTFGSFRFDDVLDENTYFFTPVYWAYQKEITDGTEPNLFSPEDTATRAQMVTFVWRAVGRPEPTITWTPFIDLDRNEYYYKPILWAYETGLTDGTDPDKFSPDDPVTNAQVVTFLYRALVESLNGQGTGTEYDVTAKPFSDLDVTEYYYKPVVWAYKGGLTDGIYFSTFGPDDPCPRKQIVTFLYRAYTGVGRT